MDAQSKTGKTESDSKHNDDSRPAEVENADPPPLDEDFKRALKHRMISQITEDILREYGVRRLDQILILEIENLMAAGVSRTQNRRLQ